MNRTKITINPDWLEFIITGSLETGKYVEEYIEMAGGFVLKDLGVGTKHFIRHYEVYHEGVILGNLRTDPRNDKILDPLWKQFKVENSRLYEKGTIDLCKRLFHSLGCTVRNVSRLDIACDGFGFMRLMKQYDSGMIEKVGKAKYTLYKNNNREIEGFDLGSKNSDKSITGYEKSKEIEKSGKRYIIDFWKRSGLPSYDGGNVERLEMRLKNNAIKKFENFDWTRLEEPQYLAGLMKKSMEKFFDFRHPVYSNKTRARKIEFINWDQIEVERLNYAEAKQSSEYIRLKQTAKTLFWLYLGTRESYYLQLCREIVENINCIMWFVDKRDFWEKEFNKKEEKKTFDYLSLWTKLETNEQLKLTENVDLTTVYKIRKNQRAV